MLKEVLDSTPSIVLPTAFLGHGTPDKATCASKKQLAIFLSTEAIFKQNSLTCADTRQ